MLHIYTTPTQPATDWIDRSGETEIRGGWKPKEMIYCECCMTRRPAQDCVVQCFYDGMRVWCSDGKGCKDPQLIEAKKAEEFANRSAGQKARWAKKSAPLPIRKESEDGNNY